MMHCKMNISSSALLQLQAISALAWNPSTHVKQQPARAQQACFLVFSHIYPSAKHKLHMLPNCSLHLGGDPAPRSRRRKVKLYQTQQNHCRRCQCFSTAGRENSPLGVWEAFLSFQRENETNQQLNFAYSYICCMRLTVSCATVSRETANYFLDAKNLNRLQSDLYTEGGTLTQTVNVYANTSNFSFPENRLRFESFESVFVVLNRLKYKHPCC